jgi:hypothetical protein
MKDHQRLGDNNNEPHVPDVGDRPGVPTPEVFDPNFGITTYATRICFGAFSLGCGGGFCFFGGLGRGNFDNPSMALSSFIHNPSRHRT